MGLFEDLIASIQGFVQEPPPDDWRYRQDPIFGGPSRDRISVEPLSRAERPGSALTPLGQRLFGGISDIELTPTGEKIFPRDEQRVRGAGPAPSPGGGTPGLPTMPGEEGIGPESYSKDDSERIRAMAQEKIAQKLAQQEAERLAGVDAQKLREKQGAENQQREFMRGTVPLAENYDQGIAIGGDPSRGSRDEILARIRAQALAKGGGTMGAGGGTFSQGTMTPEIQGRLDARDAWTAQQPLRDAQFQLSLADQRRDIPAQQVAADRLKSMQEASLMERRQSAQDAIVKAIGDGTGKIPFEKAMQLEAAGLQVPYGARGMAPEQFDARISEIISGAGVDLDRAIQAQTMGAPQEAVGAIVGFSKYIEQKARQLDAMVKAGQMSRDEALAMLQQIIDSEAQSSNAIKAAEILGFGQNQAAGE